MNKGLKLLFCNTCNTKRFCTRAPLPGYHIQWTCSKGHQWSYPGFTLERINAAVKDIFGKNSLDSAFRDSPFYAVLNK